MADETYESNDIIEAKKALFYGSVEDKPASEQFLFKKQDELFQKRTKFKQELQEWYKEYNLSIKNQTTFKKEKPVDTSREVWSEMLLFIIDYASSIIKKRTVGKKFKTPEEINDMATRAALSFMNRFNTDDTFCIGASFAGMFTWNIIEVLSPKKEDNSISLNLKINDSGNEIIDTLVTEQSSLNDPAIQRESLKTEVDRVLEEIDYVADSKLAFLARMYLLLMLKISNVAPKTRHIKRQFLERIAKSYQVEKVLESTLLEVYNRCVEL